MKKNAYFFGLYLLALLSLPPLAWFVLPGLKPGVYALLMQLAVKQKLHISNG